MENRKMGKWKESMLMLKEGNNVKQRRPRNFEDFLSMNVDNVNYVHNNLISRDEWLRESKTQQILKKIPSSELPECEDFNKSKVGDFMDNGTFQDLYDEDGTILDGLGDNGILCYYFDGNQSWWQVKQDKNEEEKDGLVRIK